MQAVADKVLTAPCGCKVNTATSRVEISSDCTVHNRKPELVRCAAAKRRSIFEVLVPGSIQEDLARRGLEKKLAFNLNACRAHEANGVPRGHSAHCLLYKESAALLEEYAARFMAEKPKEEALATLYSWFPAMYVLKAKATPPAAAAPKASQKKASIAIRVVIFVPLLCAVVVGIYQGAHHWITKLVGG